MREKNKGVNRQYKSENTKRKKKKSMQPDPPSCTAQCGMISKQKVSCGKSRGCRVTHALELTPLEEKKKKKNKSSLRCENGQSPLRTRQCLYFWIAICL